jgi:hypothetical protein
MLLRGSNLNTNTKNPCPLQEQLLDNVSDDSDEDFVLK